VVFLDKNFTPILAKKLQEKLKMIETNQNISIVKEGVVPECLREFRDQQGNTYPFSLESVVKSIIRVLNRQQHLTLDGADPPLVTRVILGFVNQYANVRFDQQFMDQMGLHHMVRVNLTGESALIELPSNLVSLTGECLGKCKET
jgi:hypothetical protein